MSLLKSHGLPFGISTCYTRKNLDDVTSEKFFDMLVESGALFVWFFHYMPVGNDAAVELLPTPEQREEIFHRIRKFRQTKAIFSMDFQNDAQFVGGCIAGGRRYLHINAKGDVEPCVFTAFDSFTISPSLSGFSSIGHGRSILSLNGWLSWYAWNNGLFKASNRLQS